MNSTPTLHRLRAHAIGASTQQVTILGAGVAGLVAAYELERLGHKVSVLEGSSRIGGRIYTYRFGEGPGAPYAELGAQRIPLSHAYTLHYIGELGLAARLCPFHTLFSTAAAYVATQRGYVRLADALPVIEDEFTRGVAGRHYKPETLRFAAWLVTVVDSIAPPALRAGLRDALATRLLDLLEARDLRPYFVPSSLRVDLPLFFAEHPDVRAACGGALDAFLDDILTETSPDLVQLRGGLDQLVGRLAAKIRGPIQRGSEVVGLQVRDQDVLVTVHRPGQIETMRCDHVVCTIPFSVLRNLRLGGFDHEKLTSLHCMTYCSATKIAFHCRTPFWEEQGITGGASFSGGALRQTYYPSSGNDPARSVLLASYAIGQDADHLGSLAPAVRHRLARREVARMPPELLRPGMVLGAMSMAWGQHQWSAGGCSVRWSGTAMQREQQRRLAARPQGRLLFAGEHCSSSPAWIDGAIASALDAVEQLVGAAPARVVPVAPRADAQVSEQEVAIP